MQDRQNAKTKIQERDMQGAVPKQPVFRPANDNAPIKNRPSDGGGLVPANDNAPNEKDGTEMVNGVAVGTNQKPNSTRGGEPVKDSAALSDQTKNTLGNNIENLVVNPNFLKQKPANDNQELAAANDNQNSGREFNNPQNFGDQSQSPIDFNIEPQLPGEIIQAAKDQDVLETIQSEMRKHKINITLEEAKILLNSKFKTKFPWVMLFISVAKLFQEIVFFSTGMSLWALGFAPNILNAIPVLGNIVAFIFNISVGLPMVVVGLAITILSIILNVIYKIIYLFWAIHYSQNALDFSKKIGTIKKFFIRYIIRRVWLVFFAFIPFVSGGLDIVFIFVIFFYMQSICRKAELAVQKAKA